MHTRKSLVKRVSTERQTDSLGERHTPTINLAFDLPLPSQSPELDLNTVGSSQSIDAVRPSGGTSSIISRMKRRVKHGVTDKAEPKLPLLVPKEPTLEATSDSDSDSHLPITQQTSKPMRRIPNLSPSIFHPHLPEADPPPSSIEQFSSPEKDTRKTPANNERIIFQNKSFRRADIPPSGKPSGSSKSPHPDDLDGTHDSPPSCQKYISPIADEQELLVEDMVDAYVDFQGGVDVTGERPPYVDFQGAVNMTAEKPPYFVQGPLLSDSREGHGSIQARHTSKVFLRFQEV